MQPRVYPTLVIAVYPDGQLIALPVPVAPDAPTDPVAPVPPVGPVDPVAPDVGPHTWPPEKVAHPVTWSLSVGLEVPIPTRTFAVSIKMVLLLAGICSITAFAPQQMPVENARIRLDRVSRNNSIVLHD